MANNYTIKVLNYIKQTFFILINSVNLTIKQLIMNFYTFIQIVFSSVAATTLMTIFSYMLSVNFRELYKEPVLLSYLLTSLDISLSKRVRRFFGWLIHYSIGFLFVLAYHILWENEIIEKNWNAALLLGAVSGIVGILGWLMMFKISKYEPNIDFKGYYLQLFFAHVIFGLGALLVYNLF